eukprot:SAG31_NODE_435_length_15733_cov_6.508251_6_plen_78_part_00
MQDAFRAQQRAGGPFGPGGKDWPLTADGVPTDYIPPPVRNALAGAPGALRGDGGKVHPQPTQLLVEAGDAVVRSTAT